MTLEDIMIVAYTDVCIMSPHNTRIVTFNWRYDAKSYISKTLLNSEVEKIEADSGLIKVWLKYREENND